MKPAPPDKSVPFLEADGRTVSQPWFDWIVKSQRSGLSDLPDVSTTAPTNGQVLVWNSTSKLWVPGAN